LPLTVGKLPLLPTLGLLVTVIIMVQFNPGVVTSAFVPLISIIILCLILTKRKIEQKLSEKF
jgi:hypothetical protein